jgi:hypothetical protein
MQEILRQYEERQEKYERLSEEHRLHVRDPYLQF